MVAFIFGFDDIRPPETPYTWVFRVIPVGTNVNKSRNKLFHRFAFSFTFKTVYYVPYFEKFSSPTSLHPRGWRKKLTPLKFYSFKQYFTEVSLRISKCFMYSESSVDSLPKSHREAQFFRTCWCTCIKLLTEACTLMNFNVI